MEQLQILIVDDEAKMAKLMAQALDGPDRIIETESVSKAALKRLKRERFDIVITDLRMPDVDGLEILEAARAHTPPSEVILVTAFASAETAVEAMKKGAFDYLMRPVKMQELGVVVERAAEKLDLKLENEQLREALDKKYHTDENIIGKSPEIAEVQRLIGRVARTKSTVLIRGASGTGKELVARSIHYRSPRMNGPFVKVNCAAIPSGLLESELFGHMRGAFTGAVQTRVGKFEQSDKGTLFLDEVGEIPLELQTKLLRVLQESEFERVGANKTIKVDVRIVAATNRNLEEMISDGLFREDLYYRLKVVEIPVPSLSERGGDVEILINHFLNKFGADLGVGEKELSEESRELLMTHDWPGNIRELENAIEHAVVMAEKETITPDDLPLSIRRQNEENEADGE